MPACDRCKRTADCPLQDVEFCTAFFRAGLDRAAKVMAREGGGERRRHSNPRRLPARRPTNRRSKQRRQ